MNVKKIYYYCVKICKTESICDKTGFKKKEYNVVAQNDRFVIIENDYFTRLTKGKEYIDPQTNKPSISIKHKGDACFSAGIYYSLYSTKKTRPSTIRNQISNHLEKEMIWMETIDLSFIK